MIVMGDLLQEFLTETGEHLDTVDRELVRFERDAGDQTILRNVFRLVHTIKGTCGFLGLPRLEALAHAAETLMARLRDGMPVTSEAVTAILAAVDRIKLMLLEIGRLEGEPPGSDHDLILQLERAAERADAPASGGSVGDASALPPAPKRAAIAPPAAPNPRGEAGLAPDSRDAQRGPATIRIGVDTIEQLMTMVSELVQTRNQMLDVARRVAGSELYLAPLQRLSHVTAQLQDSVMRARMQPIGHAWAKLPRLLRDVSADLGKQIDLVMQGVETELDRQLLELIRDPLTHMVRNSADHGIEPPAERLALGKPIRGTIRLNARHEGGTIIIELSDDGRGLDLAAIGRRAVAIGLVSEAEFATLTEARIAEFILRPGFSTCESTTAISGRGVGMDVVKSNLDAIGGTISILSEPGRGTIFTLKIPLTLAIVAALIVELDGQRFAVPQAAVLELVRVQPGSSHSVEQIGAGSVLRLREMLLPVLHGDALLGLAPRARAGHGFVVAMSAGGRSFGLLVDDVVETQEIVVKPMSARLRHIWAFSGNTILGDGTVVLILDPHGIARRMGPEMTREAHAGDARPADAASASLAPCAMLVVRSAGLKALPVSTVTRLEHVDASRIEHVAGEPWIQLNGTLVPVLLLAGTTLRREGTLPLVVMSEGGRSLALAVDEIVDIVEEVIEIEAASQRPGSIGSCVIRGRATELVDVFALVAQVGAPLREAGAPVCTVLLVDDRPFFRDMLGPVLKAAGYRVRTAANAEDALAVLGADRVEAIVADLDMPGRSGLQLIADVRREPRIAHLPVVALASCANPELLDRARELDVFDVVGKFDRSGLLAALAEADLPMGWAA